MSELDANKTKVTVISGFLGAGKTTLLNHFLRQKHTDKLAVIVNDIGTINIDAASVENAVVDVEAPAGGIVSLGGGCVCCSIQGDLIDAVADLKEQFDPDHIVIEATGAASPNGIMRSLYAPNWHGLNLRRDLAINNLVTVVDAPYFFQEVADLSTSTKRRKQVLASDHRKPLFELLIEQVECSDLLVLNKVDLLKPIELSRVRECLKQLNHKADILSCNFGEVDIAELTKPRHIRNESEVDSTTFYSNWLPKKDSDKNSGISIFKVERPHHDEFGLNSYTFTSEELLDEARFYRLIREGIVGLVRAKGFYRTRQQIDKVGVLSVAGTLLRTDYLDADGADLENRQDNTQQQLVFIGVDLDIDKLKQALGQCLI